jgi:hypothetical protein
MILGMVACSEHKTVTAPPPQPKPQNKVVGKVVNIQPGYKNEVTVLGLRFGDGVLSNFITCDTEARAEVGKTYEIDWDKSFYFNDSICYKVTDVREIQ